MIKKFIQLWVCLLGVVFVTIGHTSIKSASVLKTYGVDYQVQTLTKPCLNRVHILRVDLANKKIQPSVVIAADPDIDGPAEAALTNPLKLAEDPSILAFVNTNAWDSFPAEEGEKNRNWFEGQPVDIQGLAVSRSQVRSPSKPNAASVCFDASGHVFLGDCPKDNPPAEAMAGFQQIVTDGNIVYSPDGKRHPRTSIGVNRDGSVLWLVVVDGRQKQYSEGMDLFELGNTMRGLGCWTAINMDGGGSSIMGLSKGDGQLRIVNSPSNRQRGASAFRPLPMILTIKKTE